MDALIGQFAGFVWKGPVVGLCLIAGLYFTLRLRLIQFRCFPHAFALISGKYDNPNEKGQITHFQALSAALSGTIGLGNIAGVAIAIAMGGPGSIFWMWIIGVFGMATKYVECALGTHYREVKEDGTVTGGPMYYIANGLGKKWRPLAIFYSVCIMFAAIGAASLFQSNQAAMVLDTYYNIPKELSGMFLFVLALVVIIGGIKRIGKVTSKIVPLMCFGYVFGALFICITNADKIPDVLSIIIHDAFTGQAVAGGSVFHVIKWGVRRAIFSNEAGLGSAAIAHAAVKTDYPIREGIVASLGPLIDTIIVCTATAAVIIMSGNFGTNMYTYNDGYSQRFEVEDSTVEGLRVSQFPKNRDALRPYTDGDVVAAVKSGAPVRLNIHSKFLTEKDKQKGLRFSFFNMGSSLNVSVLDASNDVIARSTIGVSITNNASSQLLNVETSPGINQWNSAVISINNDALNAITDSSKFVTLLFETNGVDSIYLDKFESVNNVAGIALTTKSFEQFIKGFGSIFITFAVVLFAFSTIITWCYYGETACSFIFNDALIKGFRIVFVCMVFVGAITPLNTVVNFADAMLGLVVIPNIIAIFMLTKRVNNWTVDYFKQLKAGKIKAFK